MKLPENFAPEQLKLMESAQIGLLVYDVGCGGRELAIRGAARSGKRVGFLQPKSVHGYVARILEEQYPECKYSIFSWQMFRRHKTIFDDCSILVIDLDCIPGNKDADKLFMDLVEDELFEQVYLTGHSWSNGIAFARRVATAQTTLTKSYAIAFYDQPKETV